MSKQRLLGDRIADGRPVNAAFDTGPMQPPPDPRDAEIARLRAELAERDAEVDRLRDLHGRACDLAAEYRERAEQPRDDAEWKTADRKRRINDLAARYAGGMAAMHMPVDHITADKWDWEYVVSHARALAEAVVAAEEAR